jgi:hypothetical protein
LLVSWRSTSFRKSFVCLDAIAKIMVRDLLGKSACLVLLPPKRNAQTAKWPRLERFAARAVTTLTIGITSESARFVISQNALIVRIFQLAMSVTSNSASTAKIPSFVESAAWNIAMSAIPIGYLAVDATKNFVLNAKICSSVTGVASHSATTARIC